MELLDIRGKMISPAIIKTENRYNRYVAIDGIDWLILNTINDNQNYGTMELSKKIGMAPKNLIVRLKKYSESGWLAKSKVSIKPKGWKRVYRLTDLGVATLTSLVDLYKQQEENRRLKQKANEEYQNLQKKKK